ncbi:hypothetical protein BJ508DRAFT_416075 [Ascobolus immersus RN42]|uniref:Uncharacterized protein n=1 Tax=Ascobolus immersus RN42 TaxID=1160509 RepID=A0A3N4HZM0_ASCIM|nr:hypothetical protein BJ508DRAFT_416075 [Ascobolus immersus RN42]
MLVMFYRYSPGELSAKLPYAWDDYCVLWVTRSGKVAQYQREDGVEVTDIVWSGEEAVFERIVKATGWGVLQFPQFPPIPKVVAMQTLMSRDDPFFVEFLRKRALRGNSGQ